MNPGKYKAKILDYGVVEGTKGAQVKVVFGLENAGNFSYFGGLGEKQLSFTTKNLMIMGATPNNIDKVEAGPSGGVLDQNKIFELVIENNSWNGKTTQRIKYINDTTIERKGNQAFVKGGGLLSSLKNVAAQIAAEGGGNSAPAVKKPVDNVDVGF